MRRTVALGDGGRLLVTADVEAGSRAALILGLHPHELSEDVDATLPDSIELASVPIDPVAVRASGCERGQLTAAGQLAVLVVCAGENHTWLWMEVAQIFPPLGQLPLEPALLSAQKMHEKAQALNPPA